MLPAANRLADSHDFRRVVRSGRRAGTSRLVVHLLVDEDSGDDRVLVGFTVSKGVGNSVVRNRVKRRLRHLSRETIESLGQVAGGALVVVRAQPLAATANSAQLRSDLTSCLERVLR